MALPGSRCHAGGRGRGGSFTPEAELAHLPAGPGELVAGKFCDRFFFCAPGAHDVGHVGTAGSRSVRALFCCDDGDGGIDDGDYDDEDDDDNVFTKWFTTGPRAQRKTASKRANERASKHKARTQASTQ